MHGLVAEPVGPSGAGAEEGGLLSVSVRMGITVSGQWGAVHRLRRESSASDEMRGSVETFTVSLRAVGCWAGRDRQEGSHRTNIVVMSGRLDRPPVRGGRDGRGRSGR